MSDAAKLLKVFRIDRQLRGLQERLRSAERLLQDQDRTLTDIRTTRDALAGQIRQLSATAANAEGEANRLQARIDDLREKMNASNTTRDYQAYLVEVNTLTADKSKHDEEALAHMATIDELTAQVEALDARQAETERVRDVAEQDRAKRLDEIQDRLDALTKERAELVSVVPAHAMSIYNELLHRLGDDEDVMAPIEIQDLRRHEYTCGGCMMTIPMDTITAALRGKIIPCTSCGVVLYLEDETAEKLAATKK